MSGEALIVRHTPTPQPLPWPNRDLESLGAFTIRRPGDEANRVLRSLWVTYEGRVDGLHKAGGREDLLRQRLVHIGLERLRNQIEAAVPLDTLGEPDVIFAEHLDDHPEATDKNCSFQEPGRGGMLCTVSADDDPLEGRTTRSLCNGCRLPDDAIRCSSLTHIQVKDLGVDQCDDRQPVSGLCEEGYTDRVGDTSPCQLGGNDCWRQAVAVSDGHASAAASNGDHVWEGPMEEEARSVVFLVHGHDHLNLREVESHLHKLGIDARVLMDEPHQGATLIEKFERAAEAPFVVVLLTADDEGRALVDGPQAPLHRRARQNAILELGYFWGQLGRERVAVLVEDGVELPSDLGGLGYIGLSGNWKWKLEQELAAAGVQMPRRR